MIKFKAIIFGIVVILLTATVTYVVFYFREDDTSIDWRKELSYEENQIHDISFEASSPCPVIPVKINDKEVKLLFDTGNGMGFLMTTALQDQIDYDVIGTTTELNADGTYRGEGSSVLLKSINVFGEQYHDVKSSLNDWRMFSSSKFNGTIGLTYFSHKVITLDYKNKKIAVCSEPIDYSTLRQENYIVLPLIKSELSHEQDLLFFEGEVNGEKSTIYLDTGASRSFYDIDNAGTGIELKLGNVTYHFDCDKLIHDEIGFEDDFSYPLTFAINSDLLKANHFVIIIDKIQNNLIIRRN